MKRNIKVKESELVNRLNAAVKGKKSYEAPSVRWDNNGPVQFEDDSHVIGVDTAEGEDKTTVTVYKDGTPVKHYEGNDEWKNDYFSGKTVVENQIDLDPVKNMTEDEKETFNEMGPCSLEDIHRDSIEDAKESRSYSNGTAKCLDITKKVFKRTPTAREQQLIDILNGVAANAQNKDTQPRTPDSNEQCKCEHYEEVNHPQHYNNYDVEVIDMMERVFGKEETAIFCKLNAFKYRMRAGTKPGQSAEKDLNKEQWYLNKKKELEG